MSPLSINVSYLLTSNVSLAVERAHAIRTNLQHARLDELLPHIHERLPVSPGTAFTLLRLIFQHAQQDHIDLLHPPGDYHAWLLRTARLNHNGEEARANTVRLRLSLLSSIYKEAVRHQVITTSPLMGLQRPPNERAGAPLITREQLTSLHAGTKRDAALHAALVLIDEHAFRVRELLTMQWNDYDLATGAALRPQVSTRVSDTALAALTPLHRQAGGVFAHGPVLPYKQERDLRAALFQACRAADIPYASPSELRRASLRDHLHTTVSAGYHPQVGAYNLRRSTALAQGQGLAETLAPSDQHDG